MIKSEYKNHTVAVLILIVISILMSIAYFYTVEKRKTYLSNMVKYHTKMIKTGSINSLVKLGEMYEKGEGVEKDLAKAKELFKKAINFNQYLDELNPSYNDTANINEDPIDINIEDIGYIESRENIDSETNSENKSTIEIDFQFTNGIRKNNVKHVPYEKSTFSNILVIEDSKPTKKITNTNEPVTTRQFKLQETLATEKNAQLKKQETQKITNAIAKINESKAIAAAKKKVKEIMLKKAKAIAAAKKKAKQIARKKALKKSKAIAAAKRKTKLKAKKIAKARAKAKKIALALQKKSSKTKYKKTKHIGKRKIKTKKAILEAKRAPNLNEQRPDTNVDLGFDNDENQTEPQNSNSDLVLQDIIEQQTVDNNFTSNPCDTESARYIAKCRRANRVK